MIDTIDRNNNKLLGYIQSDFPITERPFLALGERLGMTEQTIIASVRSLLDTGVIRTFGPVFNPRNLGYITTLAAAEVEPDRVAELAACILEIREITHNYLREHTYNLWFTITARNDEILNGILKRIEKFPGVKRILNLPMVTVYKISAVFGYDNPSEERITSDTINVEPLMKYEIALVKALQDDFPIVDRPFLIIADRSRLSEQQSIETVQKWIGNGTIRRFGARINHRRAGWSNNVLAAWRGGDIDNIGRLFAQLPEISHCYRRTPHHDWPYELYTMVHASSNAEMKDILTRMKDMADQSKPVFMKTLYELKKTSMKYFLEDS